MAISALTLIPTPGAWMSARDLVIGDYVFGADGLPKQITLVQAYTPAETFWVELDDGLGVQGDKNMALHLEDKKYRINLCEHLAYRARPGAQRTHFKRALKRRTAPELMEEGLTHRDGRAQYSIPNAKPLQYPTRDLPVPPFIVGLWFGRRGRSRKLPLHESNFEYVTERLRGFGYQTLRKKKPYYEIAPKVPNAFLTNYVRIPTVIPEEYLRGSLEQRHDLLRGIICAKPYIYVQEEDEYQFRDPDWRFLTRVQGVCESLGIKTRLFEVQYRRQWRLTFRTDIELVVERTKKRQVPRHMRRFIKKVYTFKPEPCIHIEAGGTFLAGEGFIAVC